MAAFPLSDHGGFDEILQYIETAKPKKVICKYGDCSRLIDELRRRGFNAKSDSQPEGILSFLKV